MPNLDFGDGLFLDSESSEADYTSKAGTPLNIVLNLVCHIVLCNCNLLAQKMES